VGVGEGGQKKRKSELNSKKKEEITCWIDTKKLGEPTKVQNQKRSRTFANLATISPKFGGSNLETWMKLGLKNVFETVTMKSASINEKRGGKQKIEGNGWGASQSHMSVVGNEAKGQDFCSKICKGSRRAVRKKNQNGGRKERRRQILERSASDLPTKSGKKRE